MGDGNIRRVLRDTSAFLYVDYLFAQVMALDLPARALTWRNLWAGLRRPLVWTTCSSC